MWILRKSICIYIEFTIAKFYCVCDTNLNGCRDLKLFVIGCWRMILNVCHCVKLICNGFLDYRVVLHRMDVVVSAGD